MRVYVMIIPDELVYLFLLNAFQVDSEVWVGKFFVCRLFFSEYTLPQEVVACDAS